MTEARAILERYLNRTGLSRPADAAQQYQVALLRQWTDHLDEVLDANHVATDLRSRIIREFLYGAVPQAAEAELRETMTVEMTELRQGGPFLRPGQYLADGPPPEREQ